MNILFLFIIFHCRNYNIICGKSKLFYLLISNYDTDIFQMAQFYSSITKWRTHFNIFSKSFRKFHRYFCYSSPNLMSISYEENLVMIHQLSLFKVLSLNPHSILSKLKFTNLLRRFGVFNSKHPVSIS